MMRAIEASLLGLLLAACSGGQTGQPDSGYADCPHDSTPASEIMDRFAGSYESPVTAPNNRAECPPEADAVLHVEIESDFDERELLERECGAAWLPVSVKLTTDDGELDATLQGWLTVHEGGEGVVKVEELSPARRQVDLELDPEVGSISSIGSFDGYRTFDACCAEASDQSFPELLKLDELGLVELRPGAPDVLGQDSVELELRVTSSPTSNTCFEQQKEQLPVRFELLDAEGTVVATGTGTSDGASCPERDGCIWVQVHGSGQVRDSAYLGAAQPLNGEASRVFLDANFISCETPTLFELGIRVDVKLKEDSIEMGLYPVSSSGISKPTDFAPDRCF